MGRVSALVDTSLLARGGRWPEREGPPPGWAISAISVGELEAGVLLATDASVRAARLRRLTAVLAEAPVLGVDRVVAGWFGELRAATRRRPTNDLWIAATALAHGLTLLTADARQGSLPLVATTVVG